MIYLFRKRNGSIVGSTREAAHKQFVTPNNFITYQPEYLGAVSIQDFTAVKTSALEAVPMELEKLVKKDGEDTLVTLTEGQIQDAIENGDKRIEKQYEGLLKKRQQEYNDALEELAKSADKSQTPEAWDKRIGALEDVRGDVSGLLSDYKK